MLPSTKPRKPFSHAPRNRKRLARKIRRYIHRYNQAPKAIRWA